MARQTIGKTGIEQAGGHRAAAVMDQAQDRTDTVLAKPIQPLIMPGLQAFTVCRSGETFSQQRIAQGGHAQPGKTIQIVGPRIVARQSDLIQIAITDPVDRALGTAPQGQRR
jgi:hypothetical protein